MTFMLPDSSQRRDYWQTYLQAVQISIEDKKLDVLRDRAFFLPQTK
ncbi:hypothetical protein H6G76_15935 [Nostoc sp. FACHB-152]|nr:MULTISPECIES: hypothetical protein [unclassified Nostoc]MBD2448616.1 hypothetical protein [Nostoc sp. FACHB-152]